tara:strand:+ start:862 stop:1062 length:201 start_codon:yes stop_codon:yes gene_type:complete
MSVAAIVNAMAQIPLTRIVTREAGAAHWKTVGGLPAQYPLDTDVTVQIQIDTAEGPVTIGRIDTTA